ncbi:MAG: hypothetical protein JEZ00_21540, partial [Anaerolineaceae bacterium]|nr:hypothetical protein [Anaerolineaceae bacterium]
MSYLNMHSLKWIYQTGGWAAWIAAILFRRNMDAEYYLLHEMGLFQNAPAMAPDSILGWYALLQNQPFIGLILLNMIDLVNYILVGLIFLSLMIALWKSNHFLVILSGLCTIAAVSFSIATNQALNIFWLSTQFASASTPDEQQMLLSMGKSLLAIHQQNSYSPNGIYPSYLLISIAGLILSWMMLKNDSFTLTNAWMGLLANSFGLSYYAFHFFLPELEFIGPSVSAIFLF